MSKSQEVDDKRLMKGARTPGAFHGAADLLFELPAGYEAGMVLGKQGCGHGQARA